MKSLPSISIEDLEAQNDKMFMESLSKLDPNLFRIKERLIYHRINPELILPIIDKIHHVNSDTGYGTITIRIKNHKMTSCETQRVDLSLFKLDLEED